MEKVVAVASRGHEEKLRKLRKLKKKHKKTNFIG